MKKKLAIIIINWNGWKDTIECLNSLLDSVGQQLSIILIDNGSTDNSINEIRHWAGKTGKSDYGPYNSIIDKDKIIFNELSYSNNANKIQLAETKVSQSKSTNFIFIKSDKNLGFAKGCNIGIRYALDLTYDYIMLLNNDTTVDKNCINLCMKFMDNAEYDVVTPKILHYYYPDTIWNYGGKLTFTGSRKYFKKSYIDDSRQYRDISFITGCALIARAGIFIKYGRLTERFFFGEEDYEFSLRMRKNNIRMAAILSAKVYHKIGVSSDLALEGDKLSKAFVFYLNRIINLKIFYHRLHWYIWRFITLFFILYMIKIKYHASWKKSMRFVYNLIRITDCQDQVTDYEFTRAREILEQGFK
ncbi:glycosyltransferase family 2 protein [candidate division KSB1 bacterium]|nr:glycosyltransferase family 2 protein [candidate division KSB1 bacterium]